MKRILMVIVGVLVVAGLTLGGVYMMRDKISVMLGLSVPLVELSKTPLFKPLDKFVISLDSEDTTYYLVMESVLVTHRPDQLEQLDEYEPLMRNALVQYFSNRSNEAVRKELQDVGALQKALLAKLVTTLQGYGYDPVLDELLITKVVVQ
ncbi:flagellar basal body-associated FliL family protein [Aeromonas simiae]|uniref:Flagellar protein FliL n=1 Tax=Aeromonas simiae TaxID=218936 RepID=A0A5J6WXY4_9GAMM|nr:flagellar basal body-associated FliL family protein [Aeromonas simiae]MDO2948370.1 flagellar basal body-associated FliL family protein [Aeromonas simiae]MDO2955753.1 flagellar basal body-associated FliL family protein [Aeromonas simiae]QFI55872.1 flagellar basal body-associated FliL family protein [Aeromonas simiae]